VSTTRSVPAMNSEVQAGSTPATVETLRRQLQQLKSLHDGGALGAAQYEESKAALERRLLDLVIGGAPLGAAAAVVTSTEPARPSRRLLLGLCTFAIVFAAVGYWWIGSPGYAGVGPGAPVAGAPPVEGSAASAAPHSMTMAQIGGMVDKLAQRLKDSPQDAEGWAMLARSYTVLGRHAEALPAYQKAIALRGNDATLLADYADALAVKNKQGLAGEPMKAVERALKLDPNNIKALSLAGTEAFDRKDYALAVRHWEKIVQIGPPDSPIVQQVQGGIAEARELGKLPASTGRP
jgi:cytochrome c-type biogenesis protein CcmH